ncbi:hypothetical protein IFM53868_04389 [Aspergillus udagawae]|uniref:F-box domain-containing protein n=1 Tax=Aspergillus udagawae TaxID=91492 RepID=A0ABQ1ANI4_9EURO|nr:hypothetical protein IFM53868_04389 [Aspergillus udagawae]GFG19601.1 hypothetical protein IFM5058_10224 [Aspergillus udagawae]
MVASLPLELLGEIADYLKQAGASLAACTAVCRRWQAAFEPIIYSELHVYSEDGINEEGEHRGICLKQFRALTSGPGIARRASIRQLCYHIAVPFDLPDWMMRKREGYSSNNAVRQANNTAFQSAIIDIFKTLEVWEKSHRLSVSLVLLGREPGQEPHTKEDDEARLYTWNFTDGRTQAVPVYRARFHQDGALVLPNVSCIDKLSFLDGTDSPRYHQIWAGAAMQIVQHCPTLAELWLNLDEYIRPDHLDYLKERRQAVSEGLKDIPLSLRVFRFENQDERNWKDTMPALNVLSSSIDILSIRIRDLSLSLYELKLVQVPISLDFLWPLDEKDHSLLGNASLHWPNLEILTLKQFQPWLPSGEWIVRPDPDEEAMIAEIEDWEAEICSYERRIVERSIFEQEQFHRLFISLGYAARRMPRLRTINFDLNHYSFFYFKFLNRTGSIRLEWEVERCGSYKPDDRVAAAWGFHLDNQQLSDWEYHATLSHWPPVEENST